MNVDTQRPYIAQMCLSIGSMTMSVDHGSYSYPGCYPAHTHTGSEFDSVITGALPFWDITWYAY